MTASVASMGTRGQDPPIGVILVKNLSVPLPVHPSFNRSGRERRRHYAAPEQVRYLEHSIFGDIIFGDIMRLTFLGK